MSTTETVLFVLLALDVLASADILVTLLEVRTTLNTFVGKYHKRRATVTAIK